MRVLTAGHSPGDDAEKARIQQMGGEVKLLRNEPASASRFKKIMPCMILLLAGTNKNYQTGFTTLPSLFVASLLL